MIRVKALSYHSVVGKKRTQWALGGDTTTICAPGRLVIFSGLLNLIKCCFKLVDNTILNAITRL